MGIRSAAHVVSSNVSESGGTLAIPSPTVPLYIAAGTCSASFNAPAQDLSRCRDFAYQVVTSGSLTGSWGIYGSCEPGRNSPDPTVAQLGVVNWILVGSTAGSNAVQPFTGFSQSLVNLIDQGYKWARFQLTYTAGTGSVDVWADLKDPSANI